MVMKDELIKLLKSYVTLLEKTNNELSKLAVARNIPLNQDEIDEAIFLREQIRLLELDPIKELEQ